MECKVNSSDTHIPSKATIFLFKSPNENGADKFTESLEEAGLSCVTIPVLSFRFINQPVLRSHLSAIHLFSAIIFTSVRAVEAVVSLAKELADDRNIFQIQSFAVGKSTADAAKKYGFSPKGEDCGHSGALSEFILQEVGVSSKPLLYPCSNIHRDTLPRMLNSHGFQVTEVVAYETCPSENLKEATLKALCSQGLPDYAVFFSPSGFHYVQESIPNDILQLNKIKVISLGPATHKSICDSGLIPFGMAEKPEPECLIQLLL